MEKMCTKCGTVTPLDQFKTDKRLKSGYSSICKRCHLEYQKGYNAANKSVIAQRSKLYREKNKSKIRARRKEYYEANKERLKEKYNRWRECNTEHIKQYAKQYYENNKERIIKNSEKNTKKRRANDPVFRNVCRVRARIYKLVKSRGGSETKRTREILGCDYEMLWEYLQFTWEYRYGKPWNGEPYHIDHFVPLATAKTPSQVEKLCHYSNLQMLTPEDNMAKGDKLPF